MNEKDELLDCEADDSYILDVFPLMGNISIARPSTKNYETQETDTKQLKPKHTFSKEDSQQWLIEKKKKDARRKRIGKDLLKKTENLDENDSMLLNLMQRSRSLQTHLLYFCGIARLAEQNKWRISYGEYHKRIPVNKLGDEHKSIQNWMKRNAKGSITAVSIGVGKRGYVYVYFISTSNDELTTHDLSNTFVHFLRKKDYIPIELKAFETNMDAFIQNKYNNDSIQTLDALYKKLYPETLYMCRSGFALGRKHRTFTTLEAKTAIKEQAQETADSIIHTAKELDIYLSILSTYVIQDFNDEKKRNKFKGMG